MREVLYNKRLNSLQQINSILEQTKNQGDLLLFRRLKRKLAQVLFSPRDWGLDDTKVT
jgi:hypothetical protein